MTDDLSRAGPLTRARPPWSRPMPGQGAGQRSVRPTSVHENCETGRLGTHSLALVVVTPTRNRARSKRAVLKHELQRELELPRGRRRGNLPGRVAIVVVGAVTRENDRIRVEEIGVIEYVERLRPKLQIESLADSDFLEKRSVDVDQTRSPHRPARHVPEGPGNRQSEGLRVEPVIHGSQDHRSLEVRIPVGCVGYIGVACSGIIETNHRRLGETTLSCNDPVPLPAADQLVLEPAGPASEVLSA